MKTLDITLIVMGVVLLVLLCLVVAYAVVASNKCKPTVCKNMETKDPFTSLAVLADKSTSDVVRRTVVYIDGYGSGAAGSNFPWLTLPAESTTYNTIILGFAYTNSQTPDIPENKNPNDDFSFCFSWDLDQGAEQPSVFLKPHFVAWLKKFQSVPNNKVLISIGGAYYGNGHLKNVYEVWVNNEDKVIAGLMRMLQESAKPVANGGNGFAFDGIDFDYEDTDALNNDNGRTPTYDGVGLLIQLTKQLRAAFNKIPAGSALSNCNLISHAPQAPYVCDTGGPNWGSYFPIMAAVGGDIDFYNLQMYNNDSFTGCVSDPPALFSMGNILAALVKGGRFRTASSYYEVAPIAPHRLAVGVLVPNQRPGNEVAACVEATTEKAPAPSSAYSNMIWAITDPGGLEYANDFFTSYVSGKPYVPPPKPDNKPDDKPDDIPNTACPSSYCPPCFCPSSGDDGGGGADPNAGPQGYCYYFGEGGSKKTGDYYSWCSVDKAPQRDCAINTKDPGNSSTFSLNPGLCQSNKFVG